jgi:carbon-monoxide dehydrogenase medium subunit
MMRVAGGLVAASQYALPPFALDRPRSIAEAAAALDSGAVALAGGTDLFAQLREGLAITRLADLGRVEGLSGVSFEGTAVRIGSATTHADGASDPLLRRVAPGLADAWSRIATARVRLSGTIGGNLMAGRSRYEGRLLFGTAGATLRFANAGGMVVLPADRLGDAPPPARALLTDILLPYAGGLLFRYERALRPMMTLALCITRLQRGGFAGRVGIATERLAPVFLDLPPMADPAAEAASVAPATFAALPRDFADPMSGNAWLRAAGQATLVRALEGIGA